MRNQQTKPSTAPTSVRHRVWRWALHVPVGVIACVLMSLDTAQGLAFLAIFVCYEFSEDRWRRDEAWQDFIGCLFGQAIGPVVVVWLKAHGIWAMLTGTF